jgi:hypothetical protein
MVDYSVFNDIQKAFDRLETKQAEERKSFFNYLSNAFPIKEGLLKLLKKNNLNVIEVLPNKTVYAVHVTEKIEARVSNIGGADIYWSRGYSSNLMDEKYKQLYKHLRKVYEAQKKDEKRLPF